MSYISSDVIKVFPSTRRAAYQLSARQLSEARIAGIINQLIDSDGFVITSQENFGKKLPFEFNIKGYYFRVNTLQDLVAMFSSATDIYASIKLQQVPNTEYVELIGQDDEHKDVPDGEDGIYYGLQVTTNPLTGDNLTSLHLLTLVNDEWQIVTQSWTKFTGKSLDFIVDGGEI